MQALVKNNTILELYITLASLERYLVSVEKEIKCIRTELKEKRHLDWYNKIITIDLEELVKEKAKVKRKIVALNKKLEPIAPQVGSVYDSLFDCICS